MRRLSVGMAWVVGMGMLVSGCDRARCKADTDCGPESYCHPTTQLCVKYDEAGPALSLSVEPASVAVAQGGSVSVRVRLGEGQGLDAPVQVTLEGAPAGVSAEPLSLSAESPEGELVLSASLSADVGTNEVSLKAKSEARVGTAPLSLIVNPFGSVNVEFEVPAETAYVKDVLGVKVRVSGGTAETVELLLGEELLSTLTPPYEYAWDTTKLAEGTYSIQVKAQSRGIVSWSPARNVVVDRTAPTVTSVSPTPGAENVQARQEIRIQFSEPMIAVGDTQVVASVTSAGAKVEKRERLEGTSLSLEPISAWPAPGAISVSLGNAITDRAGNALPTQEWRYELPNLFALGGPIRGGNAAGSVSETLLKLDPAGQPVLAFVQASNNKQLLYVARWNGTAWTQLGASPSASVVSGEALGFAPDWRGGLGLSSKGLPAVAWHEGNEFGPGVATRYFDGQDWKAYPFAFLKTAVSGFDLRDDLPVILTWEQPSLVGHRLLVSSLRQNQIWEQLEITPSSIGYAELNQVALASGGTKELIVAVAGTLSGGATSVVSALSWTSGSWKKLGAVPRNFPPATSQAFAPLVVADDQGLPVVSWIELAGSNPVGAGDDRGQVFVARWTGSQWQQLGGAIGAGVATTSRQTSIAWCGDRPVVTWVSKASATDTAYFSAWDGQRWSAPAALDGNTASGSHARSPLVAGGAHSSTCVLAWSELIAGQWDLQVRKLNR